MFRNYTRHISIVFEVSFDRARGTFQPCSKYVSTVHESSLHEVWFDRRSRCVSTVLAECFDRVRVIFRQCSRFFSTELELFLTVKRYVSTDLRYILSMQEVYFHHRSRYVSTVLKYASTVLEVCLHRIRGRFRPCPRYLLIVARGIFRPCSGHFSTVLCSGYV